MKPNISFASLALVAALAIAGCTPSGETEPVSTPTPSPVQTQAPPPPIVQEPVYENYLDAPQTPGDWSYARIGGGERAGYGLDSRNPAFLMRCTGGRIALVRSSNQPSPGNRVMSIKTETATRNFTTQEFAGGTSGPLVGIALDPSDPFLDAMAITKGRIAIETEGMRTLYLPAWPEITRVIEDCR